MSQTSLCTVSFVVPCYNSSRIIGNTLERLQRLSTTIPYLAKSIEIIVVDDGSTDDTARLVSTSFPDTVLLRHPVNKGKGAAVRQGMLNAKGQYRFFMDADQPYDLEILPVMLRYLHEKEFHVVIGARDAHASRGLEKRSVMRKISSSLFTALISRIVVTGIRDTQCGLKGFRADVAEYLFSESRTNRFAFDVEILYLAYKNNLDVKRIPVHLVSEDASSVSILQDGTRMLFDVFLLPLRYHTGRYRMMDMQSVLKKE